MNTLRSYTIPIYHSQVFSVWTRGNSKVVKEMNPSEVQNTLSINFQDKNNVPTVSHITKIFSGLNKANNKAEKEGLDVDGIFGDGTPSKRGRTGTAVEYGQIVEKFVM